jgi:hypothetical protein
MKKNEKYKSARKASKTRFFAYHVHKTNIEPQNMQELKPGEPMGQICGNSKF